MEHIDVIENVANLILRKRIDEARKLVNEEYEHKYIKYETRKMSVEDKLRIYMRDGFIDRYSGKKMVFPNVLRIMTEELGEYFPYHTNWKMSDCHFSYWEFMPTYDHIIPIARGGKDISENIVTTSQIMNSAKSNFLIEEVGFKLFPRGNSVDWDGMIKWYREYVKENPKILQNKYIYQWHSALLKLA
jgi:hypothetical protein